MTDPLQPPERPEAPPLNTPHCAECDAPLDPNQRYCLECGAPTRKAPRLATGKGARVIALAIVLLALGTGFLAVAVTNHGSHSTSTTQTTTTSGTSSGTTTTGATTTTGTGTGFETVTSGTTSSTPTTTTQTSPTTSTPTTSTPTTTTTQTTPTTSTTSAASWPAGTQAWTVILASATTQSAANAVAARATSDGLSAGVLYTSAYSTLTPGYWAVFSGTYSTAGAASKAATQAQTTFPGANARFIPASS